MENLIGFHINVTPFLTVVLLKGQKMSYPSNNVEIRASKLYSNSNSENETHIQLQEYLDRFLDATMQELDVESDRMSLETELQRIVQYDQISTHPEILLGMLHNRFSPTIIEDVRRSPIYAPYY